VDGIALDLPRLQSRSVRSTWLVASDHEPGGGLVGSGDLRRR
jgi:hypothetical protein